MVASYTAAKAVGIDSIDAYLFPCKSIPRTKGAFPVLHLINPFS